MSPLLKEDVFGLFVDEDGAQIELDHERCVAVRDALRVFEGGKVRGNDGDLLVSTGTAAEMLGVSRRTVTRIIDAGEIPCEREGRGHRRVRLSDVLRYKEESDRRKRVLSEMRGYAFEQGLDDLDLESGYLDQFAQEG